MAKGKYEKWLTAEGLLQLEAWARDGLVDEQIAHNIGISRSTLNEWKKRYSDISDALKKGKDVVDIQVENALLKRALGYKTQEVIRERIKDTGENKRHDSTQALTAREWELAKAYFNGECCYCGAYTSDMTKDHLKPLAEDGKLMITNVVPACRACNSSKGTKEWLSWFQGQKFYKPERAQKICDYITFASQFKSVVADKHDGDLVITRIVEKEVLPDTTAQIFWLKNRKPDEWRDKENISLEVEPVVIINDLTE